MRAASLVALAALAPSGIAAQHLRLSIAAAGGDYREQSAALAFAGTGGTGQVDLTAGRFGLTVRGTQLDFSRSETAAPDAEAFRLRELDVRARARLVSIVGIEAGGFRRWIEPGGAAQAVEAARAGLRADYGLAPGADGNLRAGLVTGARFSGGGTADLGMALGFGLSYGARGRGLRLTVDYEFLRLDRQTSGPLGTVGVPVQSSTARLGLALVL